MKTTQHEYATAKNELRSLSQQMSNIINRAKVEGRKLNRDEAKKFDDLDNKCDRHQAVVDAYENQIPESPFKPLVNGGSRNALPQVDYVEALQAAVKNNGLFTGAAAEASREIERQTGLAAKGNLFSFDSFGLKQSPRNAITAGTDSEGGYLVPTDLLRMIDVLREMSVLNQAGATILSDLRGDISIPRKTSKTSATWAAEGAEVSATDVTFEQVAMSPSRCVVVTEPTKQLVMQSSTDVQNMLKKDHIAAINAAVEAAAINGSGSGAEPLGILGTSGIGDVAGGTDGDYPDYADLVDLETAVATDNADIGKLGYVTHSTVRGYLKQTIVDSGSGRFIWPAGANELNGYPVHITNHVPHDLVKGGNSACTAILFGNWADLLIGYWGMMDVVIDPYTLATSGKLRIVITVYVDIALRHPESFAAMQDALTS